MVGRGWSAAVPFPEQPRRSPSISGALCVRLLDPGQRVAEAVMVVTRQSWDFPTADPPARRAPWARRGEGVGIVMAKLRAPGRCPV